MKPILFSLLVFLTMNACNMSKDKVSQDISGLHDIWALKEISFNGLHAETDFSQIKTPVLELHVKDKKMYGNDGCNAIFGTIEKLAGNTIRFGTIGSTKMACPNMIIPTAFTKALLDVRTFQRKGLMLYFYNAEGQALLHFIKVD
jgi:heat shock protein HslJ